MMRCMVTGEPITAGDKLVTLPTGEVYGVKAHIELTAAVRASIEGRLTPTWSHSFSFTARDDGWKGEAVEDDDTEHTDNL